MNAVELLFKLWSPIYDRPIFQRTFYRRVHRRLLRAVDDVQRGVPERVLDLGCGTAQLTADLQAHFPSAQVIGADLSADMLRAARARLGSHAPELVRANVYALPFPDGTFDLVASSMSYHFYLEPQRALAEVARVLRPRGLFALATLATPLPPLGRLRLPHMRVVPRLQTESDFAAAGLGVVLSRPAFLPGFPVALVLGERRQPR